MLPTKKKLLAIDIKNDKHNKIGQSITIMTLTIILINVGYTHNMHKKNRQKIKQK